MDATHVARALGLPPGTRIGRYKLVRRIATGGMAEVYLAQLRGAERFAKLVALKLILPQLANDAEFARMFLEEAKLASRLHHPNVTQVLDFGEFQGEHYITMELVHGRHLLDLMRSNRGQALAHDVALTIVSAVGRALHHMHELRDHDGSALRLVHRDVSPSNVLLSYEGAVKLTDFGIAKAVDLTSATRTGSFKGKIGYCSPEQCRGEALDRRSDLFALGILLYETTTGARAFAGPNEFAVLGRVARADYVPPQQIEPTYPAALAELVTRAMAPDRDDRFASAAEFCDAIESYAHAAELRLSPARVVEAMTRSFGEAPPFTTLDEVRLLAQTAANPVDLATAVPPPTPTRARLPSLVAGVAALGLGAGLVFVLERASRGVPTATASAPTTEARLATATAAPTAAPTVVPVVASVPGPVVSPPAVVVAPHVEPTVAAALAEQPELPGQLQPPSEPASKAAKRKRPTRRDKPAGKPVPENLYPPGYKP